MVEPERCINSGNDPGAHEMNQLERVARAICLADRNDPDEELSGNGILFWEVYKREAQAAIDAMQEWMPIETAPKDGSTILVWFVPHGALSVFWEDDIWCVSNQKCDPLPVRGYRTGEDTHWMPLPEPPK